ncbi:lecithin retinol acyltransferase family protein [Paraburkholderia sabiae]|uniref:Lecithin retinol acyltransferase family protein n=1 Tax=Paraburkholderia sabiae TaxID=273251 RepID=A0ABU9QLY4_9BURK|nr:lecithin retinol acyltransferase family protein [Paraburkholderia sabiae]WJZ77271.1 lecithin retinol acyltransferase family protein [Paraburkholderia sabiae]CAD6548274.1 hypothetical protein LMG24235_04553 [Paraburkholderia sabiae]
MSIWDSIVDTFENVKDAVRSFPEIMRDPHALVMTPSKVPKVSMPPATIKDLPRGSVIKVARYLPFPYDHYGIYISEDSVIHYHNPGSGADMSGSNRITETTMRVCLDGAGEVRTVRFPRSPDEARSFEVYRAPSTGATLLPRRRPVSPNAHRYREFSPDEIAQRALGQLNRGDYNLVL